MDWSSIASIVLPYAPTLGKMLGGLVPVPGGAMLGEWAGGLLARSLGVPATPQAVQAALVDSPGAAAAALAAAEEAAVAKWEATAEIEKAKAADRTAQSQAINETMREDKASFSWYHWRNLIGYVTILVILDVLAIISYVVWAADANRLNFLVAIMPSVTLVLGFACGLNGYIAGDTSTYKENIMAGAPRESVASKVAGAVKTVTGKR